MARKKARDHPACSLIAVGKRMVANQSIGIRSGKSGGVRLFVSGNVTRAGQSGSKGPRVAHSGRPAVFGQLALVDGVDDILAHPAPALHFASARRTSRSSCMISSASVICRSNSGSYGVSR